MDYSPVCAHCGATYVAHRRHAVYCSNVCRALASRQRKRATSVASAAVTSALDDWLTDLLRH
jgi:hypothetical protein